MDDLSKMLNDSGMGCYVDNVCVNHVFFANDLCLMAPGVIGLQQLINVCRRYRIVVDLNINALKSFCFAFTPRLYQLCLPHVHINNVPLVYVDSRIYIF